MPDCQSHWEYCNYANVLLLMCLDLNARMFLKAWHPHDNASDGDGNEVWDAAMKSTVGARKEGRWEERQGRTDRESEG